MDKSTKFSVFTSFIYDNKNEGLLHKSNRLLIVSAIIYIPFFPISVFFVSLFITPIANSSLIIFLCFEKYKCQAQAIILPSYSYTSFFRTFSYCLQLFLLFSIPSPQAGVPPLILKISDYYIVIHKSSFTVRSHCYRSF